ncbi:MAG TPA: undecaprenyl/decaprenyl-phosphate alpha-N-acetylglucosaminyl 1-phosphate transferase [Acidimicrobiales bacterium]|jgi:UDP-GlcNAc:undecaprenyl-phosphate GlcNAc-1-phosphate transferase
MPSLGWYAVVLVVAAVATAALTWPARWLSSRVGYVALPGDRMVHDKATPYGGGAAMLVGFLVAMIVAALVPGLHVVFASSSEPLGVVLAGTAIFAVGLIDDVRDMSAPAKMAGQVLAASILYFLGVTMYQFKVPFGTVLHTQFIVLSPGLTPLITALWVIALTNAVNLIDGLDGLAAGVVAIGGGALAVYGLRLMQLGLLQTDNVGPLCAVIACGICLGFLPFNFSPARIFMGDAGALLLGLLMSAATMVIGGRTAPTSGVTYFFFAPLFIPVLILGVPLLDMGFAFVRRTARGTGFHTPDKDHIHHRLMRLGHGHRRSVLILWAWTALLSGFVLFPLFIHQVNAVIPFGAAALGVGLFTLFHPGLRRGALDADEPAGASSRPAGRAGPDGPVSPVPNGRSQPKIAGSRRAAVAPPSGVAPPPLPLARATHAHHDGPREPGSEARGNGAPEQARRRHGLRLGPDGRPPPPDR